MATLVTGGTGFVGANIVRELAARGHDVVSFDIMADDALVHAFIGDLRSRVTFVTGDILDIQALETLGRDHSFEKIVHAAVFTVNRTSLETARSKDILDINLSGTGNLLEFARVGGVQRFVYVSSGAAYGLTRDPDQTYNEDDPARPDNLYGITKYASECLARRYGELHGFSTVSLRVSTPYGPMERVTGHRDNMSTPYQWTGQMLRGEPITPTIPITAVTIPIPWTPPPASLPSPTLPSFPTTFTTSPTVCLLPAVRSSAPSPGFSLKLVLWSRSRLPSRPLPWVQPAAPSPAIASGMTSVGPLIMTSPPASRTTSNGARKTNSWTEPARGLRESGPLPGTPPFARSQYRWPSHLTGSITSPSLTVP